jgi:hypothetical protein
LIALRERTRFDAPFFEAVPRLELIAQTGNTPTTWIWRPPPGPA